MSAKDKIKRAAPWIFAFVVFLFTFLLSSQNTDVSHNTSRSITKVAYDALYPVFTFIRESPDWLLYDRVDFFIRKLAHMLLYFLLTLFILLGLRKPIKSKPLLFSVSFLIVLVLACADEFRQYFSAYI